jgi:hypothetical protein
MFCATAQGAQMTDARIAHAHPNLEVPSKMQVVRVMMPDARLAATAAVGSSKII